MDKKYDYYKDANRQFYETIAHIDELKQIRKECKVISDRKVKIADDTVKEFTTTGKA